MNNSYFLPYREYRYTSPLPAQAILDRISADLEPEKLIRLRRSEKPFEGKIQGQAFQMQRLIRYRNSFLPRIAGTVEDKISHREVHVRMRMHSLVEVFLIIWIGFMILLGLGMAFSMFVRGEFEAWILAFIPLPPFFFLIVMAAFLYEVNKAHSYFSEWLEAQAPSHLQ